MPELNTPKEALFLHLLVKRHVAELRKTELIVAAARTEKIDEVYARYIEAIFPFKYGEREEFKKEGLEALKRAWEAGPLKVTPLDERKGDKISKRRLAKGQEKIEELKKLRKSER